MCFRPSDVRIDGKPLDMDPIPCPECGKDVNPMGTVRLPKCPYCGAEMPGASEYKNVSLNDVIQPASPKAPTAPKDPSALA